MLTDGVMVLENVDSDDGILLLNESLKKLFNQANQFIKKKEYNCKDSNHKSPFCSDFFASDKEKGSSNNLPRPKKKTRRYKERSVGPKFDKLFS